MPRPKKKNWRMASYSLDEDIKKTLKEISEFEGISQSEMIGFLVRNWDAGINPANKLNKLMADRKRINKQLTEIDQQIELLTKQIKFFEEWKKCKSKKKDQAIEILKRNILNKEFEKTERLSKVWQRMTGIPALELIAEATQQIKKTGI